jgi:hypothetical protein
MLMLVPVATAQEIAFPNNVLTIDFRYGMTHEVLEYSLENFTYDEVENRYTLEMSDIQLELVQDFEFLCLYDLDWPVTMKFEHGFEVGDLHPYLIPRRMDEEAKPVGPMYPIKAIPYKPEEAVHIVVTMSPIWLPISDSYFLDYAVESHYIFAHDSDGGFVHGVDPYPTYLGMVNWWQTIAGEDDLIAGGLVWLSCNQPGCRISVGWTIDDWWMADGVDGMRMTNEWWASDLTTHAGTAQMSVGIETAKSQLNPKITQDADGCVGMIKGTQPGSYPKAVE